MRPTRLVGLAAILLGLFTVPAWGATPDGYKITAYGSIAPGVTFRELHSSHPETIQVTIIAPKAAVNAYVSLSNDAVAEPQAKNRLERTSQACRRANCAVGINGDYFCTQKYCPSDINQPEGGVVSDGRLLRSPYSVGWMEEQLMLNQRGCPLPPEPMQWQGTAAAGGTKLSLSGVNVDRQAGQLMLYTLAYGPRTRTSDAGSELVLRLGNRRWLGNLGQTVRATAVRFVKHGDVLIDPGTVILSAGSKQTAALSDFWKLAKTSPVKLLLSSPQPVWNSLGAKPLLLKNGQYTGQWSGKPTSPITVFAWKPDCTRFVITVDGRQKSSAGVTNRQAAQIAAGLGATTAYGLDGGGSSTMVGPNGRVLNHPSDGFERPVADSLLFVPKPGTTLRPLIIQQIGARTARPAARLKAAAPLKPASKPSPRPTLSPSLQPSPRPAPKVITSRPHPQKAPLARPAALPDQRPEPTVVIAQAAKPLPANDLARWSRGFNGLTALSLLTWLIICRRRRRRYA